MILIDNKKLHAIIGGGARHFEAGVPTTELVKKLVTAVCFQAYMKQSSDSLSSCIIHHDKHANAGFLKTASHVVGMISLKGLIDDILDTYYTPIQKYCSTTIQKRFDSMDPSSLIYKCYASKTSS